MEFSERAGDRTPKEPDPRVIRRLREGDVGALGELFETWGRLVFRLSQRLMGNQADAEDATQDIFVRVFEQAGKFDGRARFSTWLYRLAINHCLNRMQERQRRSTRERAACEEATRLRQESEDSPSAQAAREEEAEHIDHLLDLLPENHRVCIVLREIGGLSYAEIAQMLGVPTGTVMSRLSRARDQLREKLHGIEGAGAEQGNKPRTGAVKTEEAGHDEMH